MKFYLKSVLPCLTLLSVVSVALLLGDGVVHGVADLVVLGVTLVLVRRLALLLVDGLAGVLVDRVVLGFVLVLALLLGHGGVLGVVLGGALLVVLQGKVIKKLSACKCLTLV